MADYHLAVCHQCFGTAAISEWVSYDPQVAGRVLFPYQKSSHNSSRQDPNLGSSSGQPPPMQPPLPSPTPNCRRCQRAHQDVQMIQRWPPMCWLQLLSHLHPLQGCSPSAVLPHFRQDHQHGVQEGSLMVSTFPHSGALSPRQAPLSSVFPQRYSTPSMSFTERALPPSVQRRALPSNVCMGMATPATSSPRSGTPSTSNTRPTPLSGVARLRPGSGGSTGAILVSSNRSATIELCDS